MTILKRQHGFSLISAIFLLIVLAGLGAYMVTIGGTSRATSSAALQGARAYQAARSGIDWAVFLISQANDPLNQTAARNVCSSIINANSFTHNAVGLTNFTVNTSCGFTAHAEQGNDITVYTITSIASSGGSYGDLDFVQRRITATISPPPPT